ncbi:hypothetical protein F5Y16DRAFT_374117 [Xylariaceae sp. FL0255]|nr:hypothetical protein F5Y16DRAFT_374117 [Xylariaceae sp. FL0255]
MWMIRTLSSHLTTPTSLESGPKHALTTSPPPAAMAPNSDLTGHKLLLIGDYDLPKDFLEYAHGKYSGLEIVHLRMFPFNPPGEEGLKRLEKEFKDTTIIVGGAVLPTIEQGPKLQLVQLQSAGSEYIVNKPIFKDTDISFCSANGIAGPPIAEWVICTYLAHQHSIPHFLDNQHESKWERGLTDLAKKDSVGQRVGILGYGSIGRQVARMAISLGMEVYAYTNRSRPTPESRRDHSYVPPGLGDPEGTLPSKWFSGTTEAELDEFLGSGLDLLVNALPLTPQTKGMLGTPQFKLLAQKKAFISNIGRGRTIVTEDLMAALDEGLIRGAALDVTDPEPLPSDHPLWQKKNLIITPHISGNSNNYYDRLYEIVKINLERLSKGEELLNKISRKRGY